MANPNLFIYQLMNNPNAQVVITGLSTAIKAYTTQDFGFSASAQWSGRNPNAFMNMANQMEGLTKELYNRTLGKKWGEMTTGITLDVAGSMLNWQGTEPFGFTLNMYFIAIQPEDDVRQKIGILAEGIFPWFAEKKKIVGLRRLLAPNDFKKGANISDINGAVTIRIGRWFQTLPIFVITNMDFSISKETIPSGYPLYAKGSVGFKAARVLEINEVREMFGLKKISRKEKKK